MPDVTIPSSISGDETMAETIDATIRLAMDQNFAGVAATFQQAGARHNDAANFITETTQLIHQNTMQLIGAKAAGNIEQEGGADAILQHRAAAGQPGNAPSGATS